LIVFTIFRNDVLELDGEILPEYLKSNGSAFSNDLVKANSVPVS
jgi:hypothetical protein